MNGLHTYTHRLIMRISRGIPFTSPPTLRDRRVLALASTYRSVHHQLLHLRACCTSTSLACEIAVIRHPPGTNCHTNPHTLQGRRRACHTAALSFPPFSCKSSARSIRSSFPWRPPTLSGPSRARSNTSQTTTARVLSPEITPNCPLPAVLSFTRSARALAYCLSVCLGLYSPKAAGILHILLRRRERLTTTPTLMT